MKIVATVLSLAFLFTFSFSSTHACRAIIPDHWFNYDITLDESFLPSGVEVLYEQHEPDRMRGIGNKRTSLVNNSKEPLYLISPEVSGSYDQNPNSLRTEVLEGKVGYYKLVDEGYSIWSRDGFREPWDSQLPLTLDVINLNREDPIIVEDGKGRPKKIDTPKNQPFTMDAYYKGEVIHLEGILAYSLNKDYSTHDPCQFFGTSLWIVLLTLVTPFLLPLILVRVSRHYTDKKLIQILAALLGFGLVFLYFYLFF